MFGGLVSRSLPTPVCGIAAHGPKPRPLRPPRGRELPKPACGGARPHGWRQLPMRAPGRCRTGSLLDTNEALCHLSFKGLFSCASLARLERAASRLGTWRSLPLSYRDMAPQTGSAPATSGLTGRRSPT